MDKDVVLWMAGILVTINSGIIGVMFLMLWGHISQCRRDGELRSAMLATLATQQERIMKDVGDHEHGIRGALHKLRDDMSPFALWAQMEMDRAERGK